MEKNKMKNKNYKIFIKNKQLTKTNIRLKTPHLINGKAMKSLKIKKIQYWEKKTKYMLSESGITKKKIKEVNSFK